MFDLYESNDDDTLRFILGKDEIGKIFVIGLNPSTANKEKTDNTITRVEKIAKKNNINGFVMANLYPLRSTDPKKLPLKVDQALIQSNIEKIVAYARNEKNPVFWAAWGKGVKSRTYFKDALKMLVPVVKQLNGSWLTYGNLCKDGHPRHPSRLSYDLKFSCFDIERYMKTFT